MIAEQAATNSMFAELQESLGQALKSCGALKQSAAA